MSYGQIAVLGLIAGATIFLGLPFGRMRGAGPMLRAFLSAAAVGILLFLFWDVLSAAAEPIEGGLKAAVNGSGSWADFIVHALVGTGGLAVSMLGLVAYERRTLSAAGVRNGKAATGTGAAEAGRRTASPRDLALLIAIGIGLHNFAEGLAIGQSAAAGELALAGTLVIGFALHNATEGFGIVAPLAGGAEAPSWPFLGVLGLIGGGPTFLGTLVGQAVVNPTVSVAFLTLAAGSILYVVIELVNLNRAPGLKVIGATGILVGLILGFGTDFVLGVLGG